MARPAANEERSTIASKARSRQGPRLVWSRLCSSRTTGPSITSSNGSKTANGATRFTSTVRQAPAAPNARLATSKANPTRFSAHSETWPAGSSGAARRPSAFGRPHFFQTRTVSCCDPPRAVAVRFAVRFEGVGSSVGSRVGWAQLPSRHATAHSHLWQPCRTHWSRGGSNRVLPPPGHKWTAAKYGGGANAVAPPDTVIVPQRTPEIRNGSNVDTSWPRCSRSEVLRPTEVNCPRSLHIGS